MANRTKFKSITSFLDMLWILLAGFGAMFIIAFLLIQPPAKEADIIKKAEYIIVMEWEHKSKDDIDLWVSDPSGGVVSFKNKTSGFMNLEKDDLGSKNDKMIDEYGNVTIIELNREIVTLRGTYAGEYQVMLHVYARPFVKNTDGGVKGDRVPTKYTIEVIKINPYKVMYKGEGTYSRRWEEQSLVRFTIDKKGNWVGFNNRPSHLIKGKPTQNAYESEGDLEGHIPSTNLNPAPGEGAEHGL